MFHHHLTPDMANFRKFYFRLSYQFLGPSKISICFPSAMRTLKTNKIKICQFVWSKAYRKSISGLLSSTGNARLFFDGSGWYFKSVFRRSSGSAIQSNILNNSFALKKFEKTREIGKKRVFWSFFLGFWKHRFTALCLKTVKTFWIQFSNFSQFRKKITTYFGFEEKQKNLRHVHNRKYLVISYFPSSWVYEWSILLFPVKKWLLHRKSLAFMTEKNFLVQKAKFQSSL